jgi:phage N-6-adenine-methyltransferase
VDNPQPMSLFNNEPEPLTTPEQVQLIALENTIAQGLTTFVEVGAALIAIRDKELYRQTHRTFKNYCGDRWNLSKAHAYHLIMAAEIVENLSSTEDISPMSEWNIRPLSHSHLEPEQQREVWRRVVNTAPNGDITAGHVQRTVNEYKTEIAPPPEPSPVTVAPNMAVHYSSDTPEHYTPAEILDAVIACLGTIDLDPCSNSHESPNVPAARHYTAADDGLSQLWHGKVFMNPPYGREISKWVDKLCAEYEAERMTEAIVLVPARTDTDWWEQLVEGHKLICFVHGRLTFIGNEEVAPFPSALVYFGTECDRFYYAFRSFGRIMQELNPDMFGA